VGQRNPASDEVQRNLATAGRRKSRGVAQVGSGFV